MKAFSDYRKKLDDFDLRSYPDYQPGKPPQWLELEKFSYQDEYEAIWGRPWGSNGIGKLKDVALIKPTDWEGHPLWVSDRNYFILHYSPTIDVDLLLRNHEEYATLLKDCGVNVHYCEFENPWGAHGPLRKLFIAEEVLIVRGGAIIPRFGHGSFKRGLERELYRFISGLGIPTLLTVQGRGICEVAPMFVPIAEDVFVTGLSLSSNQEGLDQVLPVLYRAGVKEVHVMHLPSIMDSFDAGISFHADMFIAPVDHKKVIVYPPFLDWQTYKWLKEKGFTVIEIPGDEALTYCPANSVLIEPGKVIMPKGAVKTIKAVEAAGVEVIGFEPSGIMYGGMNGMKCITMHLYREPGPGLDD